MPGIFRRPPRPRARRRWVGTAATQTLTGATFAAAPVFPTGTLTQDTPTQTITGVTFTSAPVFFVGAVTETPAPAVGVPVSADIETVTATAALVSPSRGSTQAGPSVTADTPRRGDAATRSSSGHVSG